MEVEQENEEYDKTLLWAIEEENLRNGRGQGVSSFYLIIGALFVLVIVFLILYYSTEKEEKLDALEMIQDPNNIYEDPSDEGELIDLTEEEDKPITEEPETKNLVEN